MFSIEEARKHLSDEIGDKVLEFNIEKDTLVVSVPRIAIAEVLSKLKSSSILKMEQLISICGADYPTEIERFVIVYNLLSLSNNFRLLIKVSTDAVSPVPSVFSIYKAAVWYEREVWDMFGVMFSNNPDMRRILTDYEFEGYPLRKDFPLSGHMEVQYDEKLGKVVYVPVVLEQDYREYDTLSNCEA
ncbi:MAG: NADH-quinone oxidoreductase subunit C [Alphaproteobacteria bacterium]|nr:NADH-quinone oxidoreductase subunit C [Alphaproteobacteria bacterium]MCL2505041.1 NADH-quinone oxidoreductase subunit C [Alphaproteobacteria bacterium]